MTSPSSSDGSGSEAQRDDVPELSEFDLSPSEPCDCDVPASHELMPSGSYRANCPNCGAGWSVA